MTYPVLQGMQVYRFIFLARNWALDKHYLVSKLAKVGRKAEEEHMPLALIIYPEGTLVSKDTRPVSKKYADKMGIVSALEIVVYTMMLTALCVSIA